MEIVYIAFALFFGALAFGSAILTIAVFRSHPAEYQKNKALTDRKLRNSFLGRVLPDQAETTNYRVCNFVVIETEDHVNYRYSPAGSLSNEAIESVLLEKH